MADFDVLHQGSKSSQNRLLAIAMNQRFQMRSLADRKVHVYEGPMTLTADLHAAAITCAWALGAAQATIDRMRREKIVPVGVNRMIRSPGRRTAGQLQLADRRIASLRQERKRREQAASSTNAKRRRICTQAKQAAANYRKNPGSYHYLAGGIPNLIYLSPSGPKMRSDCSQFVGADYHGAGVESPALPLAHQWAATSTIDASPHARVTKTPRPGDLGMYGVHGGRTHHVEIYIGELGCEFIGHGSPPIDSITPGRPDYYLTFDFLND